MRRERAPRVAGYDGVESFCFPCSFLEQRNEELGEFLAGEGQEGVFDVVPESMGRRNVGDGLGGQYMGWSGSPRFLCSMNE